MVPDIAYEYARSRFRQLLLEGAELSDAQQWRQLFLSRYDARHETPGCDAPLTALEPSVSLEA
jgi:hypothetical protein